PKNPPFVGRQPQSPNGRKDFAVNQPPFEVVLRKLSKTAWLYPLMPAVRNIVVSLYLALAIVAIGGHGPVLARADAPPAPAYRTLGDANKAGINPAREAPGHTAPHITVEVVSPPVSQVEQ